MKKNVRVLGIDDAPFRFDQDRTAIVGVVVRAPGYVEGVLSSDVEVDGTDATDRIIAMVKGSRFKVQLKAVLLDSGCLGGFNVVDLEQLNVALGIPVITVTKDEPDIDSIESALRKHFTDWKRRFAHLSRAMAVTRRLRYKLYIRTAGMSVGEAEMLISRCIIRGAIPEPVRLAHIIASGVSSGESKRP
jgi:endonuclease V-like protein UPF0215 family